MLATAAGTNGDANSVAHEFVRLAEFIGARLPVVWAAAVVAFLFADRRVVAASAHALLEDQVLAGEEGIVGRQRVLWIGAAGAEAVRRYTRNDGKSEDCDEGAERACGRTHGGKA